MKTYFKNIINKLFFTPVPVTEGYLKSKESEIGARIFGPQRPNERVEFFNDNRHSWFYHQEISDAFNNVKSVTIHYEVHPMGILRISSDPTVFNEFIQGEELKNFVAATEIYHARVLTLLYNRNPNSNKNAA